MAVALVFVVSNLDSIVITRRHIAEVCVCVTIMIAIYSHPRLWWWHIITKYAWRDQTQTRAHYLPVYNV